jgi:hypothetical protein
MDGGGQNLVCKLLTDQCPLTLPKRTSTRLGPTSGCDPMRTLCPVTTGWSKKLDRGKNGLPFNRGQYAGARQVERAIRL